MFEPVQLEEKIAAMAITAPITAITPKPVRVVRQNIPKGGANRIPEGPINLLNAKRAASPAIPNMNGLGLQVESPGIIPDPHPEAEEQEVKAHIGAKSPQEKSTIRRKNH
jgi:hypothetical protein